MLQFELSGDEVNVLSELLQCRAFGPYYLTDAKFLRRLSEFPHAGGAAKSPPILPDEAQERNALRDTARLSRGTTPFR